MDTRTAVRLDYQHPEPGSPREAAIIERLTVLDAELVVAGLKKDAKATAKLRAEHEGLCREWDAGRKAAD